MSLQRVRRAGTLLIASGALVMVPSVARADSVHGHQVLTQNDCNYQWNAKWGSGIGYEPQSEELNVGGFTQSGQVDNWVTCQESSISGFNTYGWALYDQDGKLYKHGYSTGSTYTSSGTSFYVSGSGNWTLDASSTWGMHLRCATYYWYSNTQTENEVDYEQPDEGGGGGGLPVGGASANVNVAHTVNSTEDLISVPGTINPISTEVDLSTPTSPVLTPFVPNPDPGVDPNAKNDYPSFISTVLSEETGDMVDTANPTFDAWMNSTHPDGTILQTGD
jgi:hypothetical protein